MRESMPDNRRPLRDMLESARLTGGGSAASDEPKAQERVRCTRGLGSPRSVNRNVCQHREGIPRSNNVAPVGNLALDHPATTTKPRCKHPRTLRMRGMLTATRFCERTKPTGSDSPYRVYQECCAERPMTEPHRQKVKQPKISSSDRKAVSPKLHHAVPPLLRLPNGWRVSGEPRSEA